MSVVLTTVEIGVLVGVLAVVMTYVDWPEVATATKALSLTTAAWVTASALGLLALAWSVCEAMRADVNDRS
jgi:hypothetical protein